MDLFAIMKLYKDDDEVFIHAFSHDFCKIVAGIYKKQKQKKKLNIDIELKLKEVEKKVKKLML